LGAPNFISLALKTRTGSVREAQAHGDVMHVVTPARKTRRAGAVDVACIHSLERNGQGLGRPGRTGDHEMMWERRHRPLARLA
jgi:hypothetical protein